MSTLTAEIEKELRALEPETARQFEKVVRDMLQLLKSNATHHPETTTSLSERLLNHSAIGTWPANLDPDTHVQTLGKEWE